MTKDEIREWAEERRHAIDLNERIHLVRLETDYNRQVESVQNDYAEQRAEVDQQVEQMLKER